jgi:hypothetical protein
MIFENSKTYDLLVFISQVVLPAVATLWAALGKIWNWPWVTEITATICAVDAFMGAVLKISSNAYKKLNQQNEE